MPEHAPLERLRTPPIIEVVCGVVFSPVASFSALSLGEYWQERRAEFPRHEVLPAVATRAPGAPTVELHEGVPPLRIWFVSADDETVLQIQSDRMYVNWRKRGTAYPSFSGRDDHEGLRVRALREFERYFSFAERRFGGRPQATAVSLAKIDLFRQGPHFSPGSDLQQFLAVLAPFARLSSGEPSTPPMTIRFRDGRLSGVLAVAIDSGIGDDDGLGAIKLETQFERPLRAGETPDEAFKEANRVLNEVFAELVPEVERAKRFGGRLG